MFVLKRKTCRMNISGRKDRKEPAEGYGKVG